jgi:uroporphyrinogen-III decarboxylase
MTSRERVLTAFARQVPDRVPVNYEYNAGIHARLKAHFGLAADDDFGLDRRLGVDFLMLNPNYTGPTLHTSDKPGINVCGAWGIHQRWVEHDTGGYWDFCDFPLADMTEEQAATWPMPSPDHFDYAATAAWSAKHPDLAQSIGGAGYGDFMNSTGMIAGVEFVMMGMAMEDPALLTYFDRRTAVLLEVAERTIQACKGRIAFLWMGEDLGTQHTPLISLDMYRRILRPRHQKYIDLAKAYNLPVMVHTCGSSSWVYNDFIEMGVNVVDTLQPEATNMSPEYLKKTFGHALAFHGCISTAGPVATGTADETIAYCKKTLEIMMPGGGYAFAPTHQLQDNSPTENVVAMYETAAKFGAYA